MKSGGGKRLPFDPDLLDDQDPFEIDDGNRPHLFRHLPEDDFGRPVHVGPDDLLDAYLYGDPAFYPAKEGGPADWILLGQVPGLVICAPLAPPNSGNTRKCRPIGIYKPSAADRLAYLRGD